MNSQPLDSALQELPSPQDSPFVRLWLGFATARVAVGLALVVLLTTSRFLGPQHVSGWLIGMCATYLLATLAARLLLRPPAAGSSFDPQWVSSIGVDLLVFSCLLFLQAGGIYYAPLFAIPVLMAAVLGSGLLALGTAAAVALLLLADAWVQVLGSSVDMAQRFVQAGLSGIGFFALAFLAHQLALRLAREEAAAREGRRAALMQTQVNRLVIETLADGVLVVDPGGKVHAANPAARELLGAGTSRRLKLAEQPAWSPLAEMARRTFDSGQQQFSDLSIEQRAGAARRVFVRTRLASTSADRAGGLCVVFLQDLREMEARLRTEKLAAMGRMSTAVAHEIRNPLAAISQANDLLEEELQAPEHRQLSALVRQNAQRLSQIVEEILDVARVQHKSAPHGQFKPELDAVVRTCCEDWTGQNHGGDRVRLWLAAPGQHVAFDPDHLRRLLVNLLDNALRYASHAPDAIQVATTVDGPPTLTVWSDGAALEAAVERHLFEPFFSSESRSSGLGLYICRELCDRHGATIAYARTPAPDGSSRDGNEFTVTFRTRAPALPGARPFDTIGA